MKRSYISLGSNKGNRELFLKKALFQIENHKAILLLRKTGFLNNPAILYEDQEDFLNAIIEIKTELNANDLLDFLKKTEVLLGRQERFRYGPREIDLDILAYEGITCHTEKLILPHPGLLDRSYIKTLLLELGQSPESVQNL